MNISEIYKKIKEELTEKEQDVLNSMLAGDTLKGTAKKLNLSEAFAKSYRKTIYEIVSKYANLGRGSEKQMKLIDFMSGYWTETADEKERALIELTNKISNLEKENRILHNDLEMYKKFRAKMISNKSNYFVFNPYKDKPNKIYKSYDDAYADAKNVAKAAQNPVFVLRIDTLIVPHCKLESFDVVAEGISDNYLNQYNSTLINQTGDLIEESEIPF